ncbi:type II toxin-antitoxin system Phd/YefM family antitoxin [Anabaena aphanizomenioides LEGE 00250]|jgi:antitoxin VapB|uniref:Type II toxin-antitoxin system Phd/YefM family antitoxin n=1 Tax=Sphaerospermopsis aphanizomenoides LEGE 00250 TaxID=2777972 RepID=A0ABR9VAD3_9CYAN|nr:type II toxin-antitoxin system Phd/YefM family antitoxin [Sphaerospermopsis aphanizomenoides]MBE9235130.1 type II toxin-antitoxin system Phd/YefM family antitoxin [Sphaerospermopsis aphanizomenoides LEGE 00250]
MTQITLSELPPILQTLINQAKKTGETLTITDNGIPLAIISPVKKKSLLEAFANLEDIDEDFPDVDEGLLPLDDIEI